jgi:diamine N-acetyltransferase
MIKIRLAHTSDAQLIALLGRITFIQSHSQYIKNDKDVKDFCDASFLVSKIKKELANENILFWIILYDELPVGFAKVILHKKNEFIKAKNVCQLDKIYILNDFLGMKLGNTLHSTIINHVKQLKFDAIWLVTYIYNYNAIQFYESREYQKVGAIDFIVAEKGYKNHILMKNLNE